MKTTRACLATAAFVLAPATVLGAAFDEPDPVHWAYSSFFGTGWYHVDANRSVYVLRAAPRKRFTRASYDNGVRKIGWEFHYPLTLGLHKLDFEDLPGNLIPSNFGTASFTPGLELEIPVNERLSLRPCLKAGMGLEFETNDHAWIWETGLKSRYTLPSKRVQWSLNGNLNVAGHNAEDTGADHITSVLLGIEARQPLGREVWGRAWDAHWQVAYTFLDRELKFDNGDGTFHVVDDLIEVGLAFSPSGRNFNFRWWKPERLGLAFKFSPEGDFSAVTITTRTWFDQ